MAGFSSYQDFIDKTVNKGQMEEFEFTLTTANAAAGLAGTWQETLSSSPGSMLANLTTIGIPGVAMALSNSMGWCNIPINSNVSPQSRYLLDLQLTAVAATLIPGVAYLCDFLLCYPNVSISVTSTALDNTVTLPRYMDGVGVHAIVATTTTLASTAPVLTFSYNGVNLDGSSTSQQIGVLTAQVATAPISQLYTSNSVSLKPGSPFLPWSGKIQGIKSLLSYNITNGGTPTGAASVLLVKPLMQFAINTISTPFEKDLMMQFPSFVKIEDGACLGLLICPGGALVANSVLRGRIRYGWG